MPTTGARWGWGALACAMGLATAHCSSDVDDATGTGGQAATGGGGAATTGGGGAATTGGGGTATAGGGGTGGQTLNPPTIMEQGDCPTDERLAGLPELAHVVLADTTDIMSGYFDYHSRLDVRVITDAASYDALDTALYGVLPAVDFATHQVLVAAGMAPNECSWSVGPYRVVDRDGTPHLDATFSDYKQDCSGTTCSMVWEAAVVVQVPISTEPATVCGRYATGCGR
jgi:hypothetical protein